jgi:hypothetical protein
VTDAPCVNFAEALIKAYPDAKVVLSLRDPDKWLPSMERSYYEILSWRSWWLLAMLNPVFPLFLSVPRFSLHPSKKPEK